jgi:SAM-dependent methyltransferase
MSAPVPGSAPAPVPGPAAPLRRERLLGPIDLPRARGLEIGPLAAPFIAREGANVLYADYLDADGLRAKYRADPNVDISRIVDVDVIWAGGPLAACLPPGTVLDYVFASHVMEHIPDLVGWFAEIAAVLRPGGLVALAIPDKRFTFDLLRAPSRLGDLIDAHLHGLRRPAPWQVFDHHAHAVRLDDVRAAWEGRIDPAALAHHADAAIALQCAEQARAGAHLDVHCWVFTPRSLMQRLGELVALGLLPYRCRAFYETEPCAIEMLLVLERCPEGFDRAAAIASFADRAPGVADETPTRVLSLEAALDAMRRSRSWRLTAPLRAMGRSLAGR